MENFNSISLDKLHDIPRVDTDLKSLYDCMKIMDCLNKNMKLDINPLSSFISILDLSLTTF